MADDQAQAWLSLPRRIYLDTSVLQTVYDYSEVIWDGEPFQATGRAAKVQGLTEEIDALRMIFQVNQRAGFEFVVTEASLLEVIARDHPYYKYWVYEVFDLWSSQSAGREVPPHGTTLDDPRFGNISVKDRKLLQDALDWHCAAFMTMERRLPTAAAFIERETGLRVMRPTTHWGPLSRFARLYY
jgi:hypothetical protein